MRSFRLVFLSVLLAAAGAPVARAADPTLVSTPAGVVQGVDTGDAWEWRGVPYAAPPVGGLRWRTPQPADPWAGVLDATEFAAICSQLAFDPETETEFMDGSEDCLYLNVFAPPTAATDLPVMVHLHGGSNWGFRPYRNASAFVSKGVMVVTVGYRMGAFGFVGHPALSEEAGGSSGEYGLFDQIAALEWVRDNIAHFGGDPDNVTLFGESAGSFDATALVVSPLSQGLFHRAALQTESHWALRGPGSIEEAEELGNLMADSVACTDAPDVLACLRATPAEDLVLGLGFHDVAPWVGGDVLPDSPINLLAAQSGAIPLLIGSNREEAAFFFGPQVFGGERYLPSYYSRDTNAIAGPQAGRTVRNFYPRRDFDSDLWAAVAAFTDGVYTCPMRRLGLTSSGPVWRYLYTHSIENNEFLSRARAGHFMDELMLWHDPELFVGFGVTEYDYSAGEEGLSDAMATYWTNFAKTGDPNGTGVPTWPQFNAADEKLIVLDNSITTREDYRVEECEFFDSLPDIFAPAWVYARFWVAPH
jgi:para-nitrobenzyl esterase